MAEATASFVIGVPGFRHSKAFSVKIRLQSTSAMPKFRNATFSPEPSPRQLFRRLLGMPRKKALKELEQLSEETLNAFAEFLDSEEAEQTLSCRCCR